MKVVNGNKKRITISVTQKGGFSQINDATVP